MVVFASGTDSETTLTPDERYERLLDLPPSAKLVFRVLQDDAPLTQQQVRDAALLPARTTRDALTTLEDEGIIEERLYVPDARKRLYEPLPVAEPE